MKYLKQFNQASEYEAFKVGDEYITPNVSYVVETNNVKFNPYTAPASPNLVCTYNVTDISQETRILNDNGLANVTNMIVDGVEMEAETYYQFNTVGNHVVEFVLYDPTKIGENAFSNCSGLTSIVIPDSVTSISSEAFSNCIGLTSIVIPDSVTSIENSAFSNCSGLTSIVIPDSVTSIGNAAFGGCSGLTSIVIPNSVTSLGNSAFNYCTGLTSIVIPDSVTSIGVYTFEECTGLISITIPDSVNTINKNVFKNCSSLKEITCNAIIAPSIQSNTFRNVKNAGILKVPAGSDYSSWMSTDDYYLGKYNWTIEYI